jgi:hypothetical protein
MMLLLRKGRKIRKTKRRITSSLPALEEAEVLGSTVADKGIAMW